jgi:hypothetical protein
MFLSMFFPIVPAVTIKVLGVSAVEYGWMWVALSVGQAASATVLAVLGGFKRNGAALMVAALIFSVCLFFFTLVDSYWLAVALLLGMGLAFPLWVAASITLLQHFLHRSTADGSWRYTESAYQTWRYPGSSAAGSLTQSASSLRHSLPSAAAGWCSVRS